MLHPRQCSCFNCKNDYTPDEDRASLILRKWHKPTGKRPNRIKKIENTENVVMEVKTISKIGINI